MYYSVGQTSSNLMTGSPLVTITNGAAVFSVPQTGNIGVGDAVTYGSSQVAYITGKTSSDDEHWTLETATGGTPADITDATVTSINWAYTSLSAAVNGANDSNHLDATDLVAANVVLNFPCYYDSGADTTSAIIPSTWTTGPNNYINIYTPNNTATQVNQSQRHNGAWTSDAYQMDTTGQYDITIRTNYVRITGLELEASYSGNYARTIDMDSLTGNNGYIVLDSNILQGNMSEQVFRRGGDWVLKSCRIFDDRNNK